MARRFAEGTSVSVEKTRAELETLLAKHGAGQRMIATDDVAGRAVITFRLADRMVRLELKSSKSALPDTSKGDYNQKAKCPRGWNGWSREQRKRWLETEADQCDREAWRRLLLITKAKLEFIADGASTVEREFLPDILLPDGQTVHQALGAQLAESYRTGTMPPLLPAAGETD